MKIVIGCPVEGREWIIGRYLNSISNQVVPSGCDIEYAFVMGNKGLDKTADRIIDFMKTHPGTFAYIRRDGARSSLRREDRYDYNYLARARNTLMALAFETLEADYLLSVDSDILLPPDALAKLMAHQLDAVAACVCNSMANPDIMNWMMKNADGTRYTRAGLKLPDQDFPFQVDLTGACMLIDRHVWECDVRYWADKDLGGEDVGFAEGCKDAGIEMWVDPTIRTLHYMNPSTPEIGLFCPHLAVAPTLTEQNDREAIALLAAQTEGGASEVIQQVV